MSVATDHAKVVDAWIARAVEGQASASVVQAFNGVVVRLWQRAVVTLGPVTMGAVTERVVHLVGEAFPWLATLQVTNAGVDLGLLVASVTDLEVAEVRRGLRSLVIQLLTILGQVTGEILTPILHKTLSSVSAPSALPPVSGKKGTDK